MQLRGRWTDLLLYYITNKQMYTAKCDFIPFYLLKIHIPTRGNSHSTSALSFLLFSFSKIYLCPNMRNRRPRIMNTLRLLLTIFSKFRTDSPSTQHTLCTRLYPANQRQPDVPAAARRTNGSPTYTRRHPLFGQNLRLCVDPIHTIERIVHELG